ncbi:MAG: sigma-54 dependent transcriptional regulator [Candidatus Marinimicrobia bacterium]|nr:sigma-54 dependent transcriptional regulator [Candidatus Neomarinimicrobiota bacterium]
MKTAKENKRFAKRSKIKNRHEPEMITKNPKMKDLAEKARLVAESDAPVLITGESGTGKEVLSHLIHSHSNRSDNDIVAINCGAIPSELVESELFGHEKGAFTGAVEQKQGCFELADGGTLFLDEIGEMSTAVQVKLLRVLEYHSFRRVGGHEEIETDVRIIAATNKDITDALETGEFREDLFYRLNVIELHIPPLRERKEDIHPLAEYFLTQFSDRYKHPTTAISEECLVKLCEYDWPGNVRELRNVIQRMVILSSDRQIESRHLPNQFSGNGNGTRATNGAPENPQIQIELGTSLEDAERKIIRHTLSAVGDNKSEASRILGFTRQTLRNKLQKFNLS